MRRAAACAIAAVLAGQQATFRSGIDAVTVDVSVRDGSRVVAGLRAADFDLFDNGVRQDVVDVSYGKVPIDVTLALDVSFSVTGPLLERLRQATRQLMGDLAGDDRLRLIDFNMRVRRSVDFTADASTIDAVLRSAAAGGGSSILDTLAVALVSAAEPGRRQLIVIFTDGEDSTSITTPRALLDLARRTNAAVATVLAVPRSQASRRGAGTIDLLEDLAKETGGRVIDMPLQRSFTSATGRGTAMTIQATPPDLSPTFRKVLDEFRSSYVLHFTPHGVAPGGYHALEVRVKNRRGLTIHARRGYER